MTESRAILEQIVVISSSASGVEPLDEEAIALAEEVFGERHKATDWLLREHQLLSMSPATYLNNGNPKTEVLKMLQSIMHGGCLAYLK